MLLDAFQSNIQEFIYGLLHLLPNNTALIRSSLQMYCKRQEDPDHDDFISKLSWWNDMIISE